MADDSFDYLGNYLQRRSRNLFPSYGEPDNPSEFDPTQNINKKAFGVQPFGSSYYPMQQQDNSQDYESSYVPSSTLKRYLDLSAATPQREDYKPTKWGTALAAMAGGLEGYRGGANKGIASATAVRDMPYNRALDEYDTNLKSAAGALKSEQTESQLKSMADYRGGTLTEKARDRIRKEEEAKAKDTTANRKLNFGNINFNAKLNLDASQFERKLALDSKIADIQKAYNDGKLSVAQAQNAIDRARNEITSTLGTERNKNDAEANKIRGQANEIARDRADTYAYDVESDAARDAAKGNPNLEPSKQKTADEMATEEVRRSGQYGDFFDAKGKIDPPGDWAFDSTKQAYQRMLAEIERRKQGYLNTPKAGTGSYTPPVRRKRSPSAPTNTAPVEKRPDF